MSAALHPQLTLDVVLLACSLLALVFLVLPAAAGVLYFRWRNGKGKS